MDFYAHTQGKDKKDWQKLKDHLTAVADMARAALASIRAQAEVRNIGTELLLPATALRIRADRTRLLQILINLLSNAVKFTPNNGRIILRVAETSAGEVEFSVADTGIGMTVAEIEVALEPFGQVDTTLSRSFGGTGLGLPLALKLTELHGGRLEMTSIKGEGTTVKVTLRAARVVARDGVRVGGI